MVLYPQASQTVVQGGSALFQCRVTAGIPTPRAKWSRVGGGSIPSNVEELDGGVIRFNKVKGAEAGQYVCTAVNEAGSTTGVATLNIQSIPQVSITPTGSPVRVRLGQRLHLECRATGDPLPSVSWKRLRTGFLFDSLDVTETQQVNRLSTLKKKNKKTYSILIMSY